MNIQTQTKPIRGLAGADITETTLQVTLDTYGIDATVRELSYVEKRLLIVTSLMNQLKESQNDYGKTIESVANQMRVFNEQTERLQRALGNMFLPILQKILPYLNAFLMVLTEIVNWLATLFGYDEDMFSGFASGVGNITNDFIDLNDSLNSANESSKKLKQGLRGFDKLNVITTPSSDINGIGSGINPKIMEAFNKSMKEYEDRLEKVQMKATKIRDNIMEWLGFTKEVDKETGKVSFKFDHITSGTVLGALAVGGTIFNGVRKVLSFLNKIGLIKFSNIGKIFKSFNIIKGIGTGLTFVGITDFIKSLNTLKNNTLVDNIGNISSSIGEIGTGLGLIVGITTPLGLVLATIGQIVSILGNLPKHFKNITNFIKDPSWDNFWEMVESGIASSGLLGTMINKVIDGVLGGWENVKNTLSPAKQFFEDNISEPIKKIGDRIEKIYDKNIKPTIDNVKQLYDEKIEPVASKIIGIIYDIEIKSGLLKSRLDFLVTFVSGTFINKFKTGFSLFGTIAIFTIDSILNTIETFTGVLKGISDIITGIANGDWKKAWNGLKTVAISTFEGIKNGIKIPINAIIGFIETMANSVVRGINTVIKSLNKIDIKIPKWVPEFGGKEFGFDISTMKEIKIPRLKTGIDFVPNDFYGPVYLDYGERVLTKEENQRYNSGTNLNNNISNNKPQVFSPTIVVQVGNEEIARKVLYDLEDMASANGKPITIGG